jgi:hypothetical protein
MAESEEEAEENPNLKKLGRKKHYPFGTADSKGAYSAFAHLTNQETMNFAQMLASGKVSDVQPTLEEKPKRRAPPARAPKPPAAHSKSGNSDKSEVVENPANSIPDAEGLQPCTKIACALVLRAMQDVLYKNEMERYEVLMLSVLYLFCI